MLLKYVQFTSILQPVHSTDLEEIEISKPTTDIKSLYSKKHIPHLTYCSGVALSGSPKDFFLSLKTDQAHSI